MMISDPLARTLDPGVGDICELDAVESGLCEVAPIPAAVELHCESLHTNVGNTWAPQHKVGRLHGAIDSPWQGTLQSHSSSSAVDRSNTACMTAGIYTTGTTFMCKQLWRVACSCVQMLVQTGLETLMLGVFRYACVESQKHGTYVNAVSSFLHMLSVQLNGKPWFISVYRPPAAAARDTVTHWPTFTSAPSLSTCRCKSNHGRRTCDRKDRNLVWFPSISRVETAQQLFMSLSFPGRFFDGTSCYDT